MSLPFGLSLTTHGSSSCHLLSTQHSLHQIPFPPLFAPFFSLYLTYCVCMCVSVCVLVISFFRCTSCHTVHPFKMYNLVVFSTFRGV